MGNTFQRIQLTTPNDGWDRQPTQEELDNAPYFESREEFQEVLRDPQYKQSSWYRKVVEAMLEKSNPALFHVPGDEAHAAPPAPAQTEQPLGEAYTRPLASKDEPDIFPAREYQSAADREAKQDYVRQLFRDPRYKSSPLYRHEVAQKIAAMTANDGKLEGHQKGDTASISVSPYAHHGADIKTAGALRVQYPAQTTTATKPAPKEPVKGDPNIVDLGY